MERGARLRAVTNRKLSCDGNYHMNFDRNCLIFPDFEVIDSEGKSRKILAADSGVVTFKSKASFKVNDVIGFVRANKELYTLGSIMNIVPLVSPSDGDTVIEFTFKPHSRVDVSKLSHLFELYIGE
jgi:hypothetical protein